jgi:hypothetical protein
MERIPHQWVKAVQRRLTRLRDHIRQSDIEDNFHNAHYLRLTVRILEHLATLGLPLRSRNVLEVGSGAGDYSSYFLDRACHLTITDVRPQVLTHLRRRYPGEDIRLLDLEQPTPLAGAPFEVVFCYGVLYHLQRPAAALAFLSDCCSDLLLVSSQVIYGHESEISQVNEAQPRLSQSFYGRGSRFTRRWLYEELQRHFAYVYTPRTQPAHVQFPCDWSRPDASAALVRANFVASRRGLNNRQLVEGLLERQEPLP